MARDDTEVSDDREFSPERVGPPQYAARARTSPDNVWFTIGQAWPMEPGPGISVRLAMVPTGWDGELLLIPLDLSSDDTSD